MNSLIIEHLCLDQVQVCEPLEIQKLKEDPDSDMIRWDSRSKLHELEGKTSQVILQN